MNCHRVANLLSAYIDGELTGLEMLAIRRHLSECAECAKEHESLCAMKRALGRLGTIAPHEDFAVEILRRLDEVRIPPYQRLLNHVSTYMHRKLSPVAAALAAAGLAFVFLSAGSVEVQTPVGAPAATVAYADVGRDALSLFNRQPAVPAAVRVVGPDHSPGSGPASSFTFTGFNQ